MSRGWEKNIRRVTPYVAGEQPKRKDIIKLNTNENPYPPAPGVQKRLDALEPENFRKYPDMDITDITNALAENYKLEPEQIFVGIGSDDVLSIAFLTFFAGEKPILFPDITYSFYDVWADVYRIPFEQPKLDENYRIIKEDYYKENGGVVIANPNAPTSIGEPLSFIEDIVKHNQDSIVIIDEAYIDFGGESAISLIEKYENLLVVQTFSKSRSMAGMRIGFAMGNKELIQAMKDVKFSINSYTMNMPALSIGVEAVNDVAYFEETRKKIMKTREWTRNELLKLGFDCPRSQANFLFATHQSIPAKEIFEKLRENGIYVRYFNKPRLDNRLRITIGTDEEMKKFVEFLKGIGCGSI